MKKKKKRAEGGGRRVEREGAGGRIFCCFLGLVLGWEFSWRDDAINFRFLKTPSTDDARRQKETKKKVEGGASAESWLLPRVTCALSALFSQSFAFCTLLLLQSSSRLDRDRVFFFFRFFGTKVKAAAAHVICQHNCFLGEKMFDKKI